MHVQVTCTMYMYVIGMGIKIWELDLVMIACTNTHTETILVRRTDRNKDCKCLLCNPTYHEILPFSPPPQHTHTHTHITGEGWGGEFILLFLGDICQHLQAWLLCRYTVYHIWVKGSLCIVHIHVLLHPKIMSPRNLVILI